MKLMEFLLYLIFPLGLSCLWIHTAVKCWKSECKWKKRLAAICAALCVGAMLAVGGGYLFYGEGQALGLLFCFSLLAVPLSLLRITVEGRSSWPISVVAVLCAVLCFLGCLVIATSSSSMDIRKSQCLFQSQQDIEEKLGVQVPQCTFQEAYLAWGLLMNPEVVFSYDHPDSLALDSLLRPLLAAHPELCDTTRGFTNFRMSYGTTFTDSATQRLYYANIDFYNDFLSVSYGSCNEDEILHVWAADTLGIELQQNKLLRAERTRQEGMEDQYEALYRLEAPATPELVAAMERHCADTPGWRFVSNADTCAMRYGTDDYTYKNRCALSLLADSAGQFTHALLQWENRL